MRHLEQGKNYDQKFWFVLAVMIVEIIFHTSGMALVDSLCEWTEAVMKLAATQRTSHKGDAMRQILYRMQVRHVRDKRFANMKSLIAHYDFTRELETPEVYERQIVETKQSWGEDAPRVGLYYGGLEDTHFEFPKGPHGPCGAIQWGTSIVELNRSRDERLAALK